jgi:hypothetical protein
MAARFVHHAGEVTACIVAGPGAGAGAVVGIAAAVAVDIPNITIACTNRRNAAS